MACLLGGLVRRFLVVSVIGIHSIAVYPVLHKA